MFVYDIWDILAASAIAAVAVATFVFWAATEAHQLYLRWRRARK